MKIKRYKSSKSFVADLEKVGWFECISADATAILKQQLLAAEIDPENYFTIPFPTLGLYWDLESGVAYSEFVSMLSEATHHVVSLEVVREKPTKSGERVFLDVKVNGKLFKDSFDVGKWIDHNFIQFLKESIESSTDGFTLCSINGSDRQDQIFTIAKKSVLQLCSDQGIFPTSQEAQEEIAKMIYGS